MEQYRALFRWLSIPRYLTVVASYVAIAAFAFSGTGAFDTRPVLYVLIPSFVAVSAGMHVFAEKGRFPRAALIVQIWLDLAAITLGVALTGGAHSPFAPLFMLVVVSSGMVSARMSGVIGGAAIVSYVAMALASGQEDMVYGLIVAGVFAATVGLIAFQSNYYFNRIREKDEELLKLKDEFLFRTVHDVRSPSTIIKLVLSKYQESPAIAKNPAFAKDIALVSGALERTLGLVDDLLKIASGERNDIELKKESIALPDVMTELAGLLAPVMQKKRVIYAQKSGLGLPQVIADRDKLKEAMNNFLDNAIKYNKDGGRIDVSFRIDGPMLAVEIADTGLGISQESLKKLFAPYFRGDIGREIEGTGLGLYMTRKLITKMGGIVEVRSVKGEGTVFTVSLPLAKT